MGCGCRGKTGANGFVYTAPDGSKRDVRTEIEAKALVVRQGGSYDQKK